MMEGDCVLKENLIGGAILAVNGAGEGLKGVEGKEDDVMLEEEAVEGVLQPAQAVDDGGVLDQGREGILAAGSGFLGAVEGSLLKAGGGLAECMEEDDCARDYGNLDHGKALGASKKGMLDWKQTVLGNGGASSGEAEGSCSRKSEVGGQLAANKGGGGAGMANDSIPLGKKAVEYVWIGNHCRELVFEAKDEHFIEEDGVTVSLDEAEAADCERRLGRALVGKILGRTVPFGFFNRDLRRK